VQGPPGFIRNNEEWIIWILASEYGGAAPVEALSRYTVLPAAQIHDNLLYLERTGFLRLERDPAKHYPEELAGARLTEAGLALSAEIAERPDPGDLF
jgi:hypothetical protein